MTALQLINVPTVPPQDLIQLFKNFNAWELKEHEFFFQEANYEDGSIYMSRLASFIITGVTTRLLA